MKYFLPVLAYLFSSALIASSITSANTEDSLYNTSVGKIQKPVEVIYEVTEDIDKLTLAKECITDIDITTPPEDLFIANNEEMIEIKKFTGRCKIPIEIKESKLLITTTRPYRLKPKSLQVDVTYTNSVSNRKIIVNIVSNVMGKPEDSGIVITPNFEYKEKNLEYKQIKPGKKNIEGTLLIKDKVSDSDRLKLNYKDMIWIDTNGEKHSLKTFKPRPNDSFKFDSAAIYKLKKENSKLLLTSFKNTSGIRGTCYNTFNLFEIKGNIKMLGEYFYGCVGHH